jgi:hypothetical protein
MQSDLIARARSWADDAKRAGDSVTAVRMRALADALDEMKTAQLTAPNVSAAAEVLWRDYDTQYDSSGVDVAAFEPLARDVLSAALATNRSE